MDLPSWVTPAELGTFSQDHSFDLNPLVINYSAGPSNSVRLLNGELPAGLSWIKLNNSIQIVGVAEPSLNEIYSRFSFRITQSNGKIADRTFEITLTAVPQAPSWELQPSFLGYQNNSTVQSYQLIAIPPAGQHVVYSLVSSPSGMSVNSITGLLQYDASDISSNTLVIFNVSAAGSSAASDIDLTIDVIISPLNPRWVTSQGSLGAYTSDDFIEINLEATDVTGAIVTYGLTSSTAGFPLALDTDGLLYGRFINPLAETVWSFTVAATSVNGTTLRSFTITSLPSPQSLLSWISSSDLGVIEEAQIVEITVTATSKRRTVLIYNVTGGLLPPHLMCDNSQGKLTGYVEFHAVNKTYDFDISVTDGYQTITKRFTITVRKRYADQFFGAYIPVTGYLRQQWQGDVANVRVREPGTRIFSTIEHPIDPPELNIINGLVTKYLTADQIVSNVMPWMHTLDLQLGSVNNSSMLKDGTSMLYRNIVDYELGANTTVYSQAVYNTNVTTDGTVYPISIENLRLAFSTGVGYVTGGSGNGAVLSPVLDWSTGAVADIEVVSPGYGYLIPPQVTINGQGEGAVVEAILGLVSISISGPGYGWTTGEIVELPGIANVAATFMVESVGTNGSLATLTITDPGDYTQVIATPSLYVSNTGAYAYVTPTWGVVAARVISGGVNYQCGINVNCQGSEILPSWQKTYSPIIEIGQLPIIVAPIAAETLNSEPNTLWGVPWDPNYIVFQWQGLRWLGTTSFDQDNTTFDGLTTRFQETEDARITIFDEDLTIFNQGLTIFDGGDPLTYDLQQVWGSTLIDAGTTVFDLYRTIFDAMAPRRYSNTLLRKWIAMQNKVYSGNNFVW